MDEDKKTEPEQGDTPINRNLGDEWAEWVGDLKGYEKEIFEGKALFLSYYTFSVILLFVISYFAYFMISPRLYAIHPYLDQVILWVIYVVFSSFALWSVLLILTVVNNINLLPMRRKHVLSLEWLYPFIYGVAGMFKVSKDRIGHSLVKVNNALVYATRKKFKSQNLLVLLPRCLDKETRLKVTEITEKYGCTVFTATGGSSARKMVKQVMPDAIIGVACERDLISGMADSPKKITVLGIPNQRPFGPCKDTTIDIKLFEEGIRFLIKDL